MIQNYFEMGFGVGLMTVLLTIVYLSLYDLPKWFIKIMDKLGEAK